MTSRSVLLLSSSFKSSAGKAEATLEDAECSLQIDELRGSPFERIGDEPVLELEVDDVFQVFVHPVLLEGRLPHFPLRLFFVTGRLLLFRTSSGTSPADSKACGTATRTGGVTL